MFVTQSGQRLDIGAKLAAGGQGEIYLVRRPAKRAFKQYAPKIIADDPTLPARLTAMAAHQPQLNDPHHTMLAWPSDVVLRDGRFVGFLMPLIDTADTVELHKVTNPSDRRSAEGATSWLRGFTWRYSVRTAANLASATQTLHTNGTVIGDFNERNVLVSRSALVTLLDCDSMQVSDPLSGTRFLCGVGRPEFTPPELLRANWRVTVRHPSSDLFALAVHVYQLLMEGEHPFRGVWHGAGEKPGVPQLAQDGIWTGSGGNLTARPSAIGLSLLPTPLIVLFRRAFEAGSIDPSARPSAAEWHLALSELDGQLRSCRADQAHVYPAHHEECPWCRHAASRVPPQQRPTPPLGVLANSPTTSTRLVRPTGGGRAAATLSVRVTVPSAPSAPARVVVAPWVRGLLVGRLWQAVLVMAVYVGVGGYFRASASGHDPSPGVDIYLTWSSWLQVPVIGAFVAFVTLYLWRFRFRTGTSVRRIRWYGIGASLSAMLLAVVAVFNWGLLFVQSWLVEIGAVPSELGLVSVLWLAYLAVVIYAAGAFLFYLGKFVRSVFGRVVA
jgi:hypothetical protein